MALIYCSECGKQISDKAEACPHCGNPISIARQGYFEPEESLNRSGQEEDIQTIQLTKKKWKKVQLLAVALWIFGLFFIFGHTWPVAVALWFVALILSFMSRLGAWWSTG